jgi:hypothetical protein
MTKRKLPAVSPAETEILRLVWQLNKEKHNLRYSPDAASPARK